MASPGSSGILPTAYPRSDDRVGLVQREVEDVAGIMRHNVQALVQQGDALAELSTKTEDLLSEAQQFKKSSTNMKNALWWKDARLKLIIGGAVLLILLIIFFNIKNAFKDDEY